MMLITKLLIAEVYLCFQLDGDNGDPEGAANEISGIVAGDPMGKDDNGVFGRFSTANFRIGGTVRKDSEDFLASATSPLPQSASARFSTTGTPPPSFTAETQKWPCVWPTNCDDF